MRQAIKFYTDEHVSRAVIKALRKRGIDVLTVPEAGMLGATDPKHLEKAHLEGRVLFTQDDDFLRLHAAGLAHSGIAYAPQGTTIGKTIHGLVLIYQVLEAHDMKGHCEYLQT